MTNLIILMTLITQINGQLSVVPNLTKHDCEEAVCVAKHNQSCEEQAADADARAAEQTKALDEAQAWFKAHPKENTHCTLFMCASRGSDGSMSLVDGVTYMTVATVTAECIQ